jgi:hypothetical protein
MVTVECRATELRVDVRWLQEANHVDTACDFRAQPLNFNGLCAASRSVPRVLRASGAAFVRHRSAHASRWCAGSILRHVKSTALTVE